MRALVTGAAGFIGAGLVAQLLAEGHEVVGIDCLTPYYDQRLKQENLASIPAGPFTHVPADLRTADLAPLLEGIDAVFHLAAQPGVRLSWSDGFAEYDSNNVLATQRLLEASVGLDLRAFVYASSSSIYGRTPSFPTSEDELPRPHSPYGVTKLAGEHLCGLYAANHGLPTVALRYFTVYGPRQRPDMAMHRLLRAGLEGRAFPLYGDGSAIRDFTFVDDVVRANLAAATAGAPPGTVVNIAGGGEISMRDLLDLAGEVLGRPVAVEQLPEQLGDVPRTGGNIDRAQAILGWAPQVGVAEGLEAEAAWLRGVLDAG